MRGSPASVLEPLAAPGCRRPSGCAAHLGGQLVEPLAVAAHLADQVVDERRLERHLGDDLLDGLALDADRPQHSGARGRRAPAVVAATPRRRPILRSSRRTRAKASSTGLISLASSSPPSGRTMTSSAAISPRRSRSPTSSRARTAIGMPGQRPPQRDLPHLDTPADLHFLLGGQERDLADLLQIQPDRVLALGRQRSEDLLRDRRKVLLVWSSCSRRAPPRLPASRHLVRINRRIARGLSKCHRVTGLGLFACVGCARSRDRFIAWASRTKPTRPGFPNRL